MGIDTTPVDQARQHAEQVEAAAMTAPARRAYDRAVAERARAHGATAAARGR